MAAEVSRLIVVVVVTNSTIVKQSLDILRKLHWGIGGLRPTLLLQLLLICVYTTHLNIVEYRILTINICGSISRRTILLLGEHLLTEHIH